MNLTEAITALRDEMEAHLVTTNKLLAAQKSELAAKNDLIVLQENYLDLQDKHVDALKKLNAHGIKVEIWEPVVFTKENPKE